MSGSFARCHENLICELCPNTTRNGHEYLLGGDLLKLFRPSIHVALTNGTENVRPLD